MYFISKPSLFIFALLFSLSLAAQNAADMPIDTSLVLDDVTIAASKFEDNKLKIPNQLQIINQKEIALQNTQNAADLLANAGAVFVQKSQAGGGSPIIRGFEANKVLIVVDDVRLNNAIFRGGHLQNILRIDNNMLDRAEVVYGTGSLVYGSDALGGVMHFRTLQPKLSYADKTLISGATLLRYGSVNNEINGHVRLNIGGKKWAALTGITFSRFDDLKQGANPNPFCDTCAVIWERPIYVATNNGIDTVMTNPDKLIQTPSGFSQLNIMQQLRYQQNAHISHNISLKYSNTNDVPRYDRLTEMSGNLPKFAQWYYGPETWFSGTYQLKNTKKTAMYDELSLTTAYQLFKESRHSRRLNNPKRKNQYETVNAINLNADAIKNIGKQRLQYGVEMVYNKVGSVANFVNIIDNNNETPADTRYPSGGSNMWNAALYISDRYALSDKLNVNVGLRFNHTGLSANYSDTTFFKFPFDKATQNNNALVGNIGATYHIKNFKIGATISTGYRSPNIDDLGKVFESVTGNATSIGILFVPNPDLKPERTINYDLNIEKKLADKGNIFIAAFYTHFTDALAAAPFYLNGQDTVLYDGNLAAVYAQQNLDKAAIWGISGGFMFGIGKHFSVSGQTSYTVGNVLNSDGNKPLDHIAPLYGKLGVQFKNDKFSTDFYSIFNGAKPLDRYRVDGEDNLVYATPNGLPAWFTLNFKASYALNSYLNIQVGAENILDTNYRTFGSGISAGGRNLLLAIRTTF